jgi:2-dehydro-3-deoxygluconokinase
LSKISRIVCFGEIMVRLSAPGREMLLQSPELKVHIGGAEANACVSLARFGCDAAFVTMLPDNSLGEAARGELRRYGVDTKHVTTGAGRMGLYFVTPGAIHRPTEVLYDRANSAFALAKPDAVDWTSVLAGASWLHISGVTPAISANASQAALRAAKAARAIGVRVSFDSNFRAKLWESRKQEAKEILSAILAETDLLFADHRDIELATGQSAGDGDDHDRRAKAFAIAFAAFPNLKRVAGTVRKVVSVDHNDLSGVMYTRDGVWQTQEYHVASAAATRSRRACFMGSKPDSPTGRHSISPSPRRA